MLVTEGNQRAKRLRVTAVMLLVFTAVLTVMWFIPKTPISQWQGPLFWNYASHVVFIVVVILALILLQGRSAAYGLSLKNWRRELMVGGCVLVWMFVVPLLIETVWGELKLTRNHLGYVISTIVFQIIFSGFGEELLFRGFFQGEFNRVFAKKFSLGRTRFGWGMVIAAVLFGLGHLLNPFNPLLGHYGVDVGSFLGSTFVGLLFGLAREHFGGLIAVSLIHGGGDLYVSLFGLTSAGQIAVGIATITMYVWLGLVVFRGKESAQIPNT